MAAALELWLGVAVNGSSTAAVGVLAMLVSVARQYVITAFLLDPLAIGRGWPTTGAAIFLFCRQARVASFLVGSSRSDEIRPPRH